MQNDLFLDQFLRSTQRLTPPATSLLVAVSGGCDSVALLHCHYRGRNEIGLTRIGVAHVNHGLRGGESDADEQFVRDLCAGLAIPCFIKRLTGRSLQDPGIEEWARNERYTFLHEISRSEGFDLTATGHTADDQAETFFLRLMRGTGLTGLQGIHEKRNDGIIRPLLHFRKAEVRAWLQAHNLPFREDSSNANLSYERNWIRHTILPVIVEREPRVIEHIASISEDVQGVTMLLDKATNKWQNDFVMQVNQNSFSIKKDGLTNDFLAREGLHRTLGQFSIPAHRGHIEMIASGSLETGKTLLLPEGWRCTVERELVLVSQDTADVVFQGTYELMMPGRTDCQYATIWAEMLYRGDIGQPFDDRCLTVFLDAEQVGKTLEYRAWSDTDHFVPLGSKEKRGLRRYLKNHHISKRLRQSYGVVAKRGTAEIVWIPGVQIGESFKITDKSESVIKLSYQARGV